MSPHRHLFVSPGNRGHFRAKVDFRALFAIIEVIAPEKSRRLHGSSRIFTGRRQSIRKKPEYLLGEPFFAETATRQEVGLSEPRLARSGVEGG